MHAPRLTFRSPPTTSVPYYSLDGIMESRKRTLDQILSREEDAHVRHPRAWSPPPQCLSRWIGTSGPVFAFEMKFVRESSSIENAHINLAWTRSDIAGVVKNRLLRHGASLDALTEFFTDAFDFQESGMTVAHNLRWKAAVLETLFSRLELSHIAACWRKISQRGICLDSPEIGFWLGVEDGELKAFRTSLGDICQSVGLKYEAEMTTEEGALLYLDILKHFRRLAVPPCARGEAPHDFSVWHNCCMRDNGEAISATCRVCGHIT